MLTGVIARFATGTYTRTRTAAGATVDGRYTEGATATASVVGSLQPPTGQDLKSLPEGRHADGTLVFYTTSALLVTPIPDRLTIDGEQWEVFRVERWQAFGDTHYRAWLSRLPVP